MSLPVFTYEVTVRAVGARRLSHDTQAAVRDVLSELVHTLGARPTDTTTADDAPRIVGTWHVQNIATIDNAGIYTLRGRFTTQDAQRLEHLAANVVSRVLGCATVSATRRKITKDTPR